jgi:hypothetical protein
MGGGASILSVTIAENPQLLNLYRQEIADLFAEEFIRLRALGLSENEIKQQFLETLQNNETEILQRVQQQEQQQEQEGKEREATSPNFYSKAIDSLIQKGSHTFLCCIDGSSASFLAYELCMNLMKKYDSLCLFHAFCESGFPSLAHKELPTEIRKHYQQEIEKAIPPLPSTHYSFHFEECYTRSPLRVLTDLIDHHTDEDKRFVLPSASKSPDFVVLGQTGSGSDIAEGTGDDGEGEAVASPPARDPFSLGRTADLALRSIHLPCIIAKKLCPKDGPRVFVLAVNSSEQSKRGLDILLSLVASRDILELIYIQKPGVSVEKIAVMQSYYEEELRRYGPPESRFLKLSIAHQQTVAETMIDYVNNGYASSSQLSKVPDFFALSPRVSLINQAHSKLTESLIYGIQTSIILCKN